MDEYNIVVQVFNWVSNIQSGIQQILPIQQVYHTYGIELDISGLKYKQHIKARWLFIKYQTDQGGVEVEDCPTEKMWEDVLNDPKIKERFLVI